MLLGAVVALALFHGEGASDDDRTLPMRTGRAFVSEDGEIVHVALNFEQAAASRTVVLHGAGGRELAKFRVLANGSFALEPGESDSVRFLVHRRASGSVGMGVVTSRGGLDLDAQADGSAEILCKDADGNVKRSIRVDAEGGISPRWHAVFACLRSVGWCRVFEAHHADGYAMTDALARKPLEDPDHDDEASLFPDTNRWDRRKRWSHSGILPL